MLINKNNKKISSKEVEKILKEKTLLFAMWDCENKTGWPYQSGYLPIRDFFKEVNLFDPRKRRFEYGSEKMREMLLQLIETKKPDYLLCMVGSDEMSIDTIERINTLSPQTKIIAHFGDDDIDFDVFSRYYVLFVDYGIAFQKHYINYYEKDGIKNKAFFVGGANLDFFKPLNLKKEYDVSFIGSPLPSRVELMNFLLINGIKISLWGRGWNDYSEFKDIYHGPLNNEDFVKIINQSKINLGFTRNKYGELHLKGRVFEVGACKSFQLVDYFSEYLKLFKENKEIVMFKNNSDLLKKIKYYLKNENEREKIAENNYKRVVKDYNLSLKYKDLFLKTLEIDNIKKRSLPSQKNKIIALNQADFKLKNEELKDKVANYDYVSFSTGHEIPHKYKSYLHIYSLDKTGKEISCCSYYLSSKIIGNYLSFRAFRALKTIKKEFFNHLLSLSQIAVTKDYFLKNLYKFVEIFNGKEIDFINEENTAFISIPLVQIYNPENIIRNTINTLDNLSFEKAFQINFAVKLFSLINQKNTFTRLYPYKLFLWSILTWNTFIMKYITNALKSKEKLKRIKAK